MKIKVCGMRDAENISELIKLKPDFIGFIFYDKSKRFVSNIPKVTFPKEIKKIGVFVNAPINKIIEIVDLHKLDGVQLHGNESPEYISELRRLEQFSNLQSKTIIKAFSVDQDFNFDNTMPYQNVCSYLLFDTKGKNYGGNGLKFNWGLLNKYNGEVPFLLSGGISKEDVEEIKNVKHKAFKGVDINSGFEIEPALKNIKGIKEFKNRLK